MLNSRERHSLVVISHRNGGGSVGGYFVSCTGSYLSHSWWQLHSFARCMSNVLPLIAMHLLLVSNSPCLFSVWSLTYHYFRVGTERSREDGLDAEMVRTDLRRHALLNLR